MPLDGKMCSIMCLYMAVFHKIIDRHYNNVTYLYSIAEYANGL